VAIILFGKRTAYRLQHSQSKKHTKMNSVNGHSDS